VPVRCLYGSPPVQLSPKDLDEISIFGKRHRKAHAVVTIPGGFELLQDALDRSLVCVTTALLNELTFAIYAPRPSEFYTRAYEGRYSTMRGRGQRLTITRALFRMFLRFFGLGILAFEAGESCVQ
jgi:hypothetical protein